MISAVGRAPLVGDDCSHWSTRAGRGAEEPAFSRLVRQKEAA